MALRFMDGLDNYSDDADLALRGITLGATPVYLPAGGRFGGGAVELNSSTDTVSLPLNATMDGGGAIVHYALWVMFTDFPSSAEKFANLRNNAAGNSGGGITVNSSGDLGVMEYNSGAVFDGSATGVFQLNTWHHVEVASRYHASSGSHQIWVDGVLVINVSGIDSINTGTPTAIDQLHFTCGNSMVFRFDDPVVWDETGSSFTHSPYGEHRIQTLAPDADTAQVDFTPSTGTDNYAMVDETGLHDGDSSYVESTTIGHIDLYEVEPTAGTPLSIGAVAVHTRAAKTDTGTTTMRNHIYSGSTDSVGSDHVLTSGYLQYFDYFEINPDDSAAWEAADIAAIQIGFEYEA